MGITNMTSDQTTALDAIDSFIGELGDFRGQLSSLNPGEELPALFAGVAFMGLGLKWQVAASKIQEAVVSVAPPHMQEKWKAMKGARE